MWPLKSLVIYESLYNKTDLATAFQNVTVSGVSTDSRHIEDGDLFVAIPGENFDGHHYVAQALEQGASFALVSESWWQEQKNTFEEPAPLWFLRCWPVENTLTSFRQFACFFRKTFSFPVVAIGGSNGKTTTKELLFSALSGQGTVTKTAKSENGFLGVAITLCQKAHHKSHPPQALVLEIGIDDVGAMEQHVELSTPDISLLTALGPEHLVGLKNLETVITEELKLFNFKIPQRVWQLGDEHIYAEFTKRFKENETSLKQDAVVCPNFVWEKFTSTHQLNSSQNFPANLICTWKNHDPETLTFSLWSSKFSQENTLCHNPLPGQHNAHNLALAFATARSLGYSTTEILQGLSKFVPPPLRSAIRPLGTAILFEDCYNSSPLSAQAALTWLQENPAWQERCKVLILGDMRELAEESVYWHEHLADQIYSMKKTVVFLYGDAMEACYNRLVHAHGWHAGEECQMNNSAIQSSPITPRTAFWIPTNQDPTAFIKHKSLLESAVILVKGSRGMRLERVIKVLEGVFLS